MALSVEYGSYGTLRGHVARANPLWRGHVARANPLWHEHPETSDVLLIFHGAESCITPSWYASKAETRKVVPTWNYASVHAKGRLRAIHDPVWKRSQLESLTSDYEAKFEHPWAVADAPHDCIEKLLEVIVGIEIPITELKGKWKLSQNQSTSDRLSVAEGLSRHRRQEMSSLVGKFNEPK